MLSKFAMIIDYTDNILVNKKIFKIFLGRAN